MYSGASIASELLTPVRLLFVLEADKVSGEIAALDEKYGVTVSALEHDTDQTVLRYQVSEMALKATLLLLGEVHRLGTEGEVGTKNKIPEKERQ
jgi:hypothetical protein